MGCFSSLLATLLCVLFLRMTLGAASDAEQYLIQQLDGVEQDGDYSIYASEIDGETWQRSGASDFDDAPLAEVDLEFSFPYFGRLRDRVYIDPNGAIHTTSHGHPPCCSSQGCYFGMGQSCNLANSYFDLIGVVVADWNPPQDPIEGEEKGRIDYISTSKVFGVRWLRMQQYGITDRSHTFGCFIYPSGKIVVQLVDVDPSALPHGHWMMALRQPPMQGLAFPNMEGWSIFALGIYPQRGKIKNKHTVRYWPVGALRCHGPDYGPHDLEILHPSMDPEKPVAAVYTHIRLQMGEEVAKSIDWRCRFGEVEEHTPLQRNITLGENVWTCRVPAIDEGLLFEKAGISDPGVANWTVEWSVYDAADNQTVPLDSWTDYSRPPWIQSPQGPLNYTYLHSSHEIFDAGSADVDAIQVPLHPKVDSPINRELSLLCERCGEHLGSLCPVDCLGVWRGINTVDDCDQCGRPEVTPEDEQLLQEMAQSWYPPLQKSPALLNADKDCTGVCFGFFNRENLTSMEVLAQRHAGQKGGEGYPCRCIDSPEGPPLCRFNQSQYDAEQNELDRPLTRFSRQYVWILITSEPNRDPLSDLERWYEQTSRASEHNPPLVLREDVPGYPRFRFPGEPTEALEWHEVESEGLFPVTELVTIPFAFPFPRGSSGTRVLDRIGIGYGSGAIHLDDVWAQDPPGPNVTDPLPYEECHAWKSGLTSLFSADCDPCNPASEPMSPPHGIPELTADCDRVGRAECPFELIGVSVAEYASSDSEFPLRFTDTRHVKEVFCVQWRELRLAKTLSPPSGEEGENEKKGMGGGAGEEEGDGIDLRTTTATGDQSFDVCLFPSGDITLHFVSIDDPATVPPLGAAQDSPENGSLPEDLCEEDAAAVQDGWAVGLRMRESLQPAYGGRADQEWLPASASTQSRWLFPPRSSIQSGTTVQLCPVPGKICMMQTEAPAGMEIPGRLRIAALDWGCLTQPEVPLQCVFGGQVVPAWLNETTGLLECDIPPFPTAFETLPFWIRLPQPEIPSSWDIPNPAEGETIVLPEQDRYALPIAARHFFSYTNSSEEGLEPTVQAMCESCHPFAESFCALDCAGVFQGEAFLDSCGVCSGGTSGHVPDSDLDCNGQCFGNWTLDASGNCRLVENATECCANVREPRPCQEFDPMSVSAGSGASLFAEGHDPVRPRILYSFTSGLHSDARTAVTDFFDDFLESATWTRSDVSDVDDAPLQRVRLNFTISLWEGHHVREVFLSPDGAVFLQLPEDYEACLENGAGALFTGNDPTCSYSLVAASLTDYDPSAVEEAEVSWAASESAFCVRYHEVPLKTRPDERHSFDLCLVAGNPTKAPENVHSVQDGSFLTPPSEVFLAGDALDRVQDLNSPTRSFSWSGVFCRYSSMTDPRAQSPGAPGQEWFVGSIQGPEPGTSLTSTLVGEGEAYLATPLILDSPVEDVRRGSILRNPLLVRVMGAEGDTLARVAGSSQSAPSEVHQCSIPGLLCHSPSFVSASGGSHVFVSLAQPHRSCLAWMHPSAAAPDSGRFRCHFGREMMPGVFNLTTGLLQCPTPAWAEVNVTVNLWVTAAFADRQQLLHSRPLLITFLEPGSPFVQDQVDPTSPLEDLAFALCPELGASMRVPLPIPRLAEDGSSSQPGPGLSTPLCIQDCAGQWHARAFQDKCGVCSGGESGQLPGSGQDCEGLCWGPFHSVTVEGQSSRCGCSATGLALCSVYEREPGPLRLEAVWDVGVWVNSIFLVCIGIGVLFVLIKRRRARASGQVI